MNKYRIDKNKYRYDCSNCGAEIREVSGTTGKIGKCPICGCDTLLKGELIYPKPK